MYQWKQKDPGESLGEFFLYLGIDQVSVFDGKKTIQHDLGVFAGIAKFESSIEVDGPVELLTSGEPHQEVHFVAQGGVSYAFRGAEWVDGKFYIFALIHDSKRGMLRRGRFTLERLYKEIGVLPLRLRVVRWFSRIRERTSFLGAIMNPL